MNARDVAIRFVVGHTLAEKRRRTQCTALRLDGCRREALPQLESRTIHVGLRIARTGLSETVGVAIVLAPHLRRIHHAVSGAQDRLGVAEEVVGEADARAKVLVVFTAPVARLAAGAGKDQAAGQAIRQLADGVEVGGAVVALDGLRLVVVTQAQIQREAARELPIVLKVAANRMAHLRFAQVSGDAGAAHRADQIGREGAAGAGRRKGIASEASREAIVARGRGTLQIVPLQQAQIETDLQRMRAAYDVHLIQKLPVQAAAQAGRASIEARQAVADGRKSIGGHNGRKAQLLRPTAAKAADHEGEVTARGANAQFVDNSGRKDMRVAQHHIPVLQVVVPLGNHFVGINGSAARAVVRTVIEERVPAKDGVLVGEPMVALQSVLPHLLNFAGVGLEVVGVGEGVGRRAIRNRVELVDRPGHRINLRRRNDVAGVELARDAGAGALR